VADAHPRRHGIARQEGDGIAEAGAGRELRARVPGMRAALLAASLLTSPFAAVGPGVAPSRAYLDGPSVTIAFQVRSAAPVDLLVDVTREATGGRWRRWIIRHEAQGQHRRLHWDGRTVTGVDAPDGSYVVTVTPRGGMTRRLGRLVLHGHFFPIRGPHVDRGGLGEFGQPRSGGRIHEGFDVNAACGTPLVAARGGRVIRSNYDPVRYGNVVIIRSFAERRDYWYAHLQHPARVARGQDVTTGQRLGEIGATGNARTVGCHLHFEIHQDGVPIDPKPSLHAWDSWS